MSITSEVLPTSDYSLDSYTKAAPSQVELFKDFRLLNSYSTTLAGLPAHMIIYSFTDGGPDSFAKSSSMDHKKWYGICNYICWNS